ncbi:MAG: CheR family methyltransferase [Candidatus Sulfobium sp.]
MKTFHYIIRRARFITGRSFHIILCRNVLIYMNKALQEEVLANISGILHTGGYLVLRESETIPAAVSERFTRAFPEVKIYRRNTISL